ncbi:putative zinc-type alcohol dehydrogenase-like protein [Geodermatophilus tzadiensis]|uniref:alcohol dehydrogenase (NADP(+)) n=1 Tax=Geodermatophilus tzadiensis TaxID=1137988 RepID=A0A2T0SUU5_9ACTN|nr:NAD(P)-dependent alcohol dehydrogenase [Geodermatophilus tzadiensis]PRY37187.1 putative zinc-type alcohol dehydrogenase-like protein [Geodermatophilus tzadiensis]
MPTTVKAYAATSATEPLTPTMIERRDVGPHDVRIDIRYCGVCHSDIHTARGEWGATDYPIVLGHEIAGIVAEVGAEVTRFRVGDRVGVGCLVDSCRECRYCRRGDEQFCAEGYVETYSGTGRDGRPTQGGYAEAIVVTEDFVLRIPDALALDVAAPLLCAGITAYSPLRHWGVGPGTRVAVVGLGGLGHMAVQLAAAMGAEVTVLSQSLKKQEDGLRLGATHYAATSDPDTFARLAASFDLVVNTVSASIDVDAYLSLVDVDGTMVNVGIPEHPQSLDVLSLLMRRVSYAASNIGGIRETQEMLDFCAEHGIAALVETIGVEQANEAYERVVASDVRYRFVIDTATLA